MELKSKKLWPRLKLTKMISYDSLPQDNGPFFVGHVDALRRGPASPSEQVRVADHDFSRWLRDKPNALEVEEAGLYHWSRTGREAPAYSNM